MKLVLLLLVATEIRCEGDKPKESISQTLTIDFTNNEKIQVSFTG